MFGDQVNQFFELSTFLSQYGRELVFSLGILVVGLILSKTIAVFLKNFFLRYSENYSLIHSISIGIHVSLMIVTIGVSLDVLGVDSFVINSLMTSIVLVSIGLVIVFRPYIPTLPFKVGDFIKTGDLLGKVEATSVLNVRLKTIDGKTVFVPNKKILNDYIINYHFTPYRRVEVEVGIGYDQDLIKAKQIIEILLLEDPRIMNTPRPVVYVVNLADSCVELSGRGWVENVKYWRTKCDLLEKVKLRFDQERITIAFPQRDIHIYHETTNSRTVKKDEALMQELISE